MGGKQSLCQLCRSQALTPVPGPAAALRGAPVTSYGEHASALLVTQQDRLRKMAGEDVSWAWRLQPRLPLLGLRSPLVDSGSFSFLGSPPVSQAFPGIVHLQGRIPGTHTQGQRAEGSEQEELALHLRPLQVLPYLAVPPRFSPKVTAVQGRPPSAAGVHSGPGPASDYGPD
ncbi:unnamed protein product [Rangifer tarandus platyrhynchus]|uniref:Uncharacterized protein n=1 Tax=Rangifer tarandus platyrhynchus TaxID=3082113 RepID=A0AC59Z2J8_RANTA